MLYAGSASMMLEAPNKRRLDLMFEAAGPLTAVSAECGECVQAMTGWVESCWCCSLAPGTGCEVKKHARLKLPQLS